MDTTSSGKFRYQDQLFLTKQKIIIQGNLNECKQVGPMSRVYQVTVQFKETKKKANYILKNVMDSVKSQLHFSPLNKNHSALILAKHQNVLQATHYFYHYDNSLMILMKKASQTLEDKIKKPINEQNIMKYTKQIINGLYYLHIQFCKIRNYLHNNRLVHRDLKPSNILFFNQKQQVLKISDLEMSKIVDEIKNNSNTVVGSYRYASPQVLFCSSEKHYTSKADIWSFGIILVQMLGYKMFKKCTDLKQLRLAQKQIQSQIQTNKIISKIHAFRGNLNQTQRFWRELIAKMLRYEQKNRCSIIEIQQFFCEHEQAIMQIIYRKQNGDIKIEVLEEIQQPRQIIPDSWYDIHKFQSVLITNILEIKEELKKVLCKKIHIYVLLFLSMYSYQKSFQEGILKQNSYQRHYKNQLLKENRQIIGQKNQNLIEAKDSFQKSIRQESNKNITKIFKILLETEQIIQKGQQEELLRSYISTFEDQIQLCPIAKSYLPFFWIVCFKKRLINQNQLHKIIQDYPKIFRKISRLKNYYIEKQKRPINLYSKQQIIEGPQTKKLKKTEADIAKLVQQLKKII